MSAWIFDSLKPLRVESSVAVANLSSLCLRSRSKGVKCRVSYGANASEPPAKRLRG